jgi:hypothetical protein
MQRFGIDYHRRIKMNSKFLKKLLAVALTGLFLVSAGADAATKCKKGMEPDAVTGKCKTIQPK